MQYLEFIDEIKEFANNAFLLVKQHWFLFVIAVILNALFLLSLILANMQVFIQASDSIKELNNILQEKTKNLNATELISVETQLRNDTYFMGLYKNVQYYVLKFLAISIISFLIFCGSSLFIIYQIAKVNLTWQKFVINFILIALSCIILLSFILITTPNSWLQLLLFILFLFAATVSFSCLGKKPLFKTILNKIQDKRIILHYLAGIILISLIAFFDVFLFSKADSYPNIVYLSFAWLLFIILPSISFLELYFIQLVNQEQDN